MFGVDPGLSMVESIWRIEVEGLDRQQCKLSFPSFRFSSLFLIVSGWKTKPSWDQTFMSLASGREEDKEGTSQIHQVFTLSNKSLFLLVKAGHIALKWGEMLSAVTIVSQGECFGRKPVFNHIATSHHYRASLSATTWCSAPHLCSIMLAPCQQFRENCYQLL